MTTYQWANVSAGGDWNDPQNWEVQGQAPPGGPPGAGDDVFIELQTPGVITTDGATVASLNANTDTTLNGDLTVTGQLDGGFVSGGDVNAGQFDFAFFKGGTLSAGSISGGSDLDGGTVSAGQLIWANISGATVSASSIDVAADVGVIVNAGTVSAQTLLLDQVDAFVEVNSGAVTVASAATISGPGAGPGGIIVSGGTLSLQGGLTLDAGAFMNDGAAAGSAGGVVTAQNLTIGGTGSGRVFVGGSSAHLNVSGDLILGQSGAGSLTIANGGFVMVGGNLESAVDSGGTASGTLSDSAAQLAIAGDWQIGVNGAATWTLASAVTVSVGGSAVLGVSSGGSGTLTLSDAETTLVAGGGGVTVGAQGQGNLTIQSGALLDDAAGELTLAEAQGSKAALQINNGGSTLIVGDQAVVGAAGSATLVMDGGSATFSAPLMLGQSQGATGGLSVTDGGVTIAADMTVGSAGTGTVTVGASGTIGPGSLAIPAGSTDTITLGQSTTGKGTLNVSGRAASVRSIGLIVGDAGGGTLNIGSAGRVTTSGSAIVGEAVTSIIQKVTVTSAGVWIVGDNLTLGQAAIATATVSSGGVVEVDGNLTMGAAASATGILVLSGGLTSGDVTADSALWWGGVLDVGEDGTGNLTISADSEARVLGGGQGLLEIGSVRGATGLVTVSGAGAELGVDSLAIGGTLTAVGGAGSLTLGSGSLAADVDGGVIWATGRATVDGLLEVDGALAVAGALTVGGASPGSVAGTGTLALTGGTTALETGAALSIAKVAQSGAAAVTISTAGLKYAGVWAQSGGSISVGAGDTLAFTGTGDSFAGTLTGTGRVEFENGSDTFVGATLAAAAMLVDDADVTLSGVINLTKTLTVTSPDVTIAAAGASLSGDGELALTATATNAIVGASAAATLTNVDDKIVGAGDIGDGKLTLVNEADGSITGDGAAAALTLNTGSATIDNAGEIISKAAGGVTIKGAVDNTGRFAVTAGTLTVSGAVTGAGAVFIEGGTADFQGAFGENVDFDGTTGVLELAKSQSYAGEISGFSLTGGTSLDLGDIGFTSGVTKATFVENSEDTRGVLTVTSGTETTRITLIGNFSSSTFTTAGDGHGGTIVTDPTKAASAAAVSLVHAIASFGGDAGQGAAIIAEPARSPEPLLAAARPNDGGARRASWV
jgi:T5SS/PEP-CTERM-associated repeat protein